MTRQVVIVQEFVPQYRIEFFELLRAELFQDDISLSVVAGQPPRQLALRRDAAAMQWMKAVRNWRIGKLTWQPVLKEIAQADLVIVEHANRHILNWLLIVRRMFCSRPVLGYWGHGTNLQARRRGICERIKEVSARFADCWFAYTEGSAARVEGLGYPADRICVVQNSQSAAVALPVKIVREPYQCIYVGGLSGEKRISFLLQIAKEAERICSSFKLVVVGDGPDRRLIEECNLECVDYKGALFGEAKAKQLTSSTLMLCPGLVGLAVIDAFNARTPVVCEDWPYHSPEFEYLDDGGNALVLRRGASDTEYANAIIHLLRDDRRLENLRAGCATAASKYTVEAMVENFSFGIRRALRA